MDRRSYLRAVGAGALGTVAVSVPIGSVGAQSGGDVTTLDVREGPDQSLPVVDELLIFAHGWFGSSSGPGQAADLAGVLADEGYEPDEVVAFVYRADASAPEDAFAQAEAAVTDFVPILQAAIDAGAGSIRLAGHSLGGRVVLGTLTNLDDGYVVDTAAPMGTAAVGSTVTEGGRWYEGVANHAAAVRNYHSQNDGVIQGDFGPNGQFGSQGDTALGAQGVPDPSAAPSTYTDVDVTDSVGGHGGYMTSQQLGQDLAAAIARQDDGEPTPTETATPTPTDAPDDTCSAPTAPAWSDGTTPHDVDDDGVYEDMNGNCEFDSDDVVTYFQEIDRDGIQENPGYYDANGNGNADFDDVVTLFQQL